ncbi:TolB family protein [Salinimicrobium sp. GXAS 041]|uniref:TolB family protein n=1 Tax=Salinimicrobium sp. GXAS 041 TaxID=3400806 RepID=UPI003C78675B
MKSYLSILFFFTIITLPAQENSVGIFSHNRNIGATENFRNVTYNPSTQIYTLNHDSTSPAMRSSGNMYVYNKLQGDFIFTAHIDYIANASGHKAGLMIRKTIEEDEAHASASLTGNGTTFFEWREVEDTSRDSQRQISSPKTSYDILQLERKGEDIIMRAAHFGEPLQKISQRKIKALEGEVLVGLFNMSEEGKQVQPAKFWNVRIDKPVLDDYDPGKKGWLGCRLETLDVESGMRKVIYQKDDRFEAPNWMPGGEELLFNMEGSLYIIPVAGGKPEKLNTGFADNLNNDHGISFDGKMLAISHHADGEGSKVYVLPLEGGTPRLVTPQAPSYWHGWAPSNDEVVYVATREGNSTYDIYRKSIYEGKEVQLTSTGEGEHVDGCEYSPDGKFVYYNSSASGTMQIWRMKPDGSAKEQLTFDARNDWFPHISPDGKWIAYISFPAKIPVNAHPSFKRVTLNLMPTSGGAPKVIAYLYGGQGTINVPSWSPDSKYLSFVSNSGRE